MSMPQVKASYEYTQEEFVQRLERSVQNYLGTDLDTF